jgi:ribosomal protein L12E/L44/L45/RPP1/RPP2
MLKKESTVWNWDEIIEASDEEIDALIETLEGDDLESFMSEFNELSEMYTKATPGVKKDGQEKLEPRAPAEKAFANMHNTVEKDHPFDKDQHDQGVKSQAKARPGDKRANETMKTLKDIRK